MKPLLFLLATFGLLLLAACESDLATTPADHLKKKLILTPAHIEGELYMVYGFRAEVTNVPDSEVTFFWDFDEGQDLVEGQAPSYIFFQPKVHNVRVRAYDSTNAIVGYDSMRVDIRPPARMVEITTGSIDTFLQVTSAGVPIGKIVFKLNAGLPENMIDAVWDFGDGTPIFQEQYTKLTVAHEFTSAGTFTVRVSVYEKTGAVVGADSVTVTIRMPQPTADDLLLSKSVSVWLEIDTTDPVSKDPLFRNPFAIGLPIAADPSSTFDATAFNVFHRKQVEGAGSEVCLDTITGRFSNDHLALTEVNVSVNDTGSISGSRGEIHYTFTLTGLQFLAITNDKIVYRTTSPAVSEFARNITFSASKVVNFPRGILLNDFTGNLPPERKAGPYGLVVFER